MIFYILYRIGTFLALVMPLRFSYAAACVIADCIYCISARDRRAVIENLKVILNSDDEKRLDGIARQVFRNFAKYLVDFFRFAKVDERYIKDFIEISGLENLDEAIGRGRGVIVLSAHLGNWELGAAVVSLIGYPLSAVVLTHSHKKVNDFFTRQRRIGNVRPIEIGMSLRACYKVLGSKSLLAMLGDRDFSKSGMDVEFFGRKTLIPKGPAVLSRRLGSAVVPTFMVREPDDTFRLIFERPIYPDGIGAEEEKAVESLAGRYLKTMERYIRQYPEQWYIFRGVWNNGTKDLRPDTII